MSDGNVKYFKLYKEKDGTFLNYIIPVRESKTQWSVEGLLWDGEWRLDLSLVNPDDWEERQYSEDSYLKIVPMTEAPDKRRLIGYILSSE